MLFDHALLAVGAHFSMPIEQLLGMLKTGCMLVLACI